MKTILFTNWTLWRSARLIFSVAFIIAGLLRYDTVLTLAGVFLFFHALLNRCATCNTDTCKVPKEK